MDNRIKELIAVGASVTANCQPCFQYHIGKAKEHGADEQEISEAILAAKMVRKGAMSKMDQFIASAAGDAEVAPGASEKGCGCGS